MPRLPSDDRRIDVLGYSFGGFIAQLKIYRDAGHSFFCRHPAEFAAEVEAFPTER